MRKFKTKGLTLVEVLLAVVVTALLVALVLFSFRPAKEFWCGQNCLGNLYQISLAMKAYANDDVAYQLFPMLSSRPTSSNELFDKTLVAKEYVKDIKVFRCPSDQFLTPSAGLLTDVGHNSYSSCHGVKDDGGTDTPILADTLPHAYYSSDGELVGTGYNVFYSDGHGIFSTGKPPLIGRLDALYPRGAYVKAAEMVASIEENHGKRGEFWQWVTPVLVTATVVGIVFIVWQLIRAKRMGRNARGEGIT